MSLYAIANEKRVWVVAADSFAEAVKYCTALNLAPPAVVQGWLVCSDVRAGLEAGIIGSHCSEQEFELIVHR